MGLTVLRVSIGGKVGETCGRLSAILEIGRRVALVDRWVILVACCATGGLLDDTGYSLGCIDLWRCDIGDNGTVVVEVVRDSDKIMTAIRS